MLMAKIMLNIIIFYKIQKGIYLYKFELYKSILFANRSFK